MSQDNKSFAERKQEKLSKNLLKNIKKALESIEEKSSVYSSVVNDTFVLNVGLVEDLNCTLVLFRLAIMENDLRTAKALMNQRSLTSFFINHKAPLKGIIISKSEELMKYYSSVFLSGKEVISFVDSYGYFLKLACNSNFLPAVEKLLHLMNHADILEALPECFELIVKHDSNELVGPLVEKLKGLKDEKEKCEEIALSFMKRGLESFKYFYGLKYVKSNRLLKIAIEAKAMEIVFYLNANTEVTILE